MSYIIIWRNSHRDPHIDIDSKGFKEEYMSFEDAKKTAEEIKKNENENKPSPWYFDYQIYKLVNE
jgi:hypothetical protein